METIHDRLHGVRLIGLVLEFEFHRVEIMECGSLLPLSTPQPAAECLSQQAGTRKAAAGLQQSKEDIILVSVGVNLSFMRLGRRSYLKGFTTRTPP